jgi:hypothetical protein
MDPWFRVGLSAAYVVTGITPPLSVLSFSTETIPSLLLAPFSFFFFARLPTGAWSPSFPYSPPSTSSRSSSSVSPSSGCRVVSRGLVPPTVVSGGFVTLLYRDQCQILTSTRRLDGGRTYHVSWCLWPILIKSFMKPISLNLALKLSDCNKLK